MPEPTPDGVPRDPVDLDGYVPAFANPGALLPWVSPRGLARKCELHEVRWHGIEDCWVCEAREGL